MGFRSGYELEVADPSPSVVVSGEFDFGTFTHFNNPIFSGTSITSVGLTITTDVILDGVTTIVSGATFLFTFNHNETPNSCSPLPDCANDIVTVSLLNDTSTVTVDGVKYTLSFLGFLQNGVLNEQFSSPEGQASSGVIRAEFTSEVPGVPLPAAGWLLLAGVGGLAAVSRKKKKAAPIA